MLWRETVRDDLPFTKIKVFNRLRYGLSDPETVRTDEQTN